MIDRHAQSGLPRGCFICRAYRAQDAKLLSPGQLRYVAKAVRRHNNRLLLCRQITRQVRSHPVRSTCSTSKSVTDLQEPFQGGGRDTFHLPPRLPEAPGNATLAWKRTITATTQGQVLFLEANPVQDSPGRATRKLWTRLSPSSFWHWRPREPYTAAVGSTRRNPGCLGGKQGRDLSHGRPAVVAAVSPPAPETMVALSAPSPPDEAYDAFGIATSHCSR
ncbi:hypothetical protein CDEST_06238 [Colletotrichum destructivum]|uniref:Uncharacterized protein n=1 Tax=Colletotrichum destructivum TaxID=34406 RepID=A0AAX4ID82_9PEZI|nr:hypothetical protein CDEST_06238 [Colletotrichum destructivum]